MPNKTKIEWCDVTINPLGWGCYGPNGTMDSPKICSYCYAKRLAMRGLTSCPDCNAFRPHWHSERLSLVEKLRGKKVIFWQSMGDLFHKETPDDYILQVIDTCKNTPRHAHVFLTKNPERYCYYRFPKNCYIGYSDDGTKDERNWQYLPNHKHLFVSFEPLLGEIVNIHTGIIKQVIIGAQTGVGAIKPSREVVEETIKAMDKAGIPVFLKNNLMQIYPDLPKRRELIWLAR